MSDDSSSQTMRWLASANHMRRAIDSARDGFPPVEFNGIELCIPDGTGDLWDWQDPCNEESVTFGIQRDCDPEKIALYVQRTGAPRETSLITHLTLNEEQALALATGLLVALTAKPAAEHEED